MKKLIGEYRVALRRVNKARARATSREDRSLLAGCADSLDFAIRYMEMGKNPDSRRGITRQSNFKREIPMDPQSVAFVRAVAIQGHPPEVSEETQKAIDGLGIVLKALSAKERLAYLFVRGSGYSYQEAAELMKITKASVQTLVKRAEDKIYHMVSDLTDSGIVFREPRQPGMF